MTFLRNHRFDNLLNEDLNQDSLRSIWRTSTANKWFMLVGTYSLLISLVAFFFFFFADPASLSRYPAWQTKNYNSIILKLNTEHLTSVKTETKHTAATQQRSYSAQIHLKV